MDPHVDACGSCGLSVATIRSIRGAEDTAPPVSYARSRYCSNCFAAIPGVLPVDDQTRDYCTPCSTLKLEAERLSEQFHERARLNDPHELNEPVVWPPLRELLAEHDAQTEGAGMLMRPRPGSEWVAARRPEVAWLACLAAPAIDVHLQPLSRRILRETFPDVRPIEWEVLLRP